MSDLVDLTRLTGEDLRHLAYLADRRAERAEQRMAEMNHKPALGSYLDRFHAKDPESAWDDALAMQEARHLANPQLIAGIVREIAEYTDDRELIAKAAVIHAEKCGIPRKVFVPIIANALREVLRDS